MAELFTGFGFTGFRSFGSSDLQYIGPMSKIHLLAGPNNAGKSNVIELVQRVFPALISGATVKLEAVDLPLNAESGAHVPLRIAIAKSISEAELAESGAARLTHFLDAPTFRRNDEIAWFEYALLDRSGFSSSPQQIAEASESTRGPDGSGGTLASQLSGALTGHRGGEAGADVTRILQHLQKAWNITASVPPVALIGAFRQIRDFGAGELVEATNYNGPGLIRRLQELQNPSFEQREDALRFEQINHFVKTLFGDDAAIEIPHDARTILVHYGGQRLPLENLGSGFQEVVILAAAATVLTDHLVCIEEPEIHLHPSLQRTLPIPRRSWILGVRQSRLFGWRSVRHACRQRSSLLKWPK
jgi:hypothetical protein